MVNYKTTEEKSAEWNISTHHVQYLCRTGKIDGAIKRAGAWFIPDNAPIPTKNTKAGAEGFRFVGTKKRIFDASIELFKVKGFNSVSLRDIAESVSARQSTIYNHFKSKQEILDVIYDFYCHYYLKDRPSFEEMDAKMKTCEPIEIIGHICYEFSEDYRQKMLDITMIVFQRMPVDDRAREISKSLMVDEGISYVEEVFKRGVASGNLAPFDTRSMAVFINSIRIFTLYRWIIDPSPESLEQMIMEQSALFKYAAGLLRV